MRTVPVHHILPIRRASYPCIDHLLAHDRLRPAPGLRLQHDRPTGSLFQLSRPCSLTALSPRTLALGPHSLLVDLYRLPTAEDRAVQAGSPRYVDQPGLGSLSAILWSADVTPREAAAALVATSRLPMTATGRGHLPREPHFEAAWHQDEFTLMRVGRDWFCVLHFDLTYHPRRPTGPRVEVALDLGGQPAVQAVTSQGALVTVPSTELAYARQLRPVLTPSTRDLLDQVQFYAQRFETLRLAEFLVDHARVVYAENLTYRDMDREFVRRARRSGVLDFHESWLHNRLQAAGIAMEKVDPTGTSQRCHACPDHPWGVRVGHQFRCSQCGLVADAHVNAALNVMHLGRVKAARWRAAQRDPVSGGGSGDRP